ncbi:MAG: pyridoxal phosphate-dependent aminotransferase [Candidatus Zixiibacteriota bacterium]|nr:MAG: pyridoxal phosphate-dependent aminotransferase [candidate division Zixibacteria bacterium]
MIKKIILDKADRLYHFPFDLEDFFPKRTLRTIDRRYPLIDLGRFRWPVEGQLPPSRLDSGELAQENDLLALKEAIASWLKAEHGLRVVARKEIYIGQGIRRMLLDLCLAFVEYGDVVLCPEPGMPFYKRQVITAGGVPVAYPATERTGFKPSTKKLSSKLGTTAKILILNNPHNPTGVLLDETDLSEIIRVASKANIFIVNDAAYCALAEEKYQSLLSVPGGAKVGLELFSAPFTFGLPYIPLGFAVGPPALIGGLEAIAKALGAVISGTWIEPTIAAVKEYPSPALRQARKKIGQSRLEAEQLVENLGWEMVGSKSSPFVWIKIPGRQQSRPLAQTLLKRKGILALPGNAFGENGEGYFRLSLTASVEDFRVAAERLAKRLTIMPKARE